METVKESKTNQVKKLYRVISIIPKFERRGCIYKDVCIMWFAIERDEPQVPYNEALFNYNPDDAYGKEAIKELFTESEAKALSAYLLDAYNDNSVEFREINLPWERNNEGPYMAVAVGGGQDFYALCKTPGYNLNFKVWGYYDIRDNDYVDDKESFLQTGLDCADKGQIVIIVQSEKGQGYEYINGTDGLPNILEFAEKENQNVYLLQRLYPPTINKSNYAESIDNDDIPF